MSVDWWRCSPHYSRKSVLVPPLLLLTCVFFFLNYNIRLTTDSYHKHRQPSAVAPCTLQRNIIFVKTHKCASSTIQNVLMRFGDSHNLTFALHPKINYLGHPQPFRRNMVPDLTPFNRSYNILAHHSVLNRDEMLALIPDNPVVLTIVRDPVDLFESLYSYYSLGGFYRLPLTKFSTLPKNSRILQFRSLHRFGTNQMLFDLGFQRDQFQNLTAVREYVRYLDQDVFDLVLISEWMDESLILLRDLLCWDIEDVVAFKVNARSDRFKRRLPEKARERLRQLNAADQILYDHFRSRFETRLDAFGRERMSHEVADLHARVRSWYDFCVNGQDMLRRIPGAYQSIASPQVLAFRPKNNTNDTCWRLTAPELEFTDRLRKKQAYMFPKLQNRRQAMFNSLATKKKVMAMLKKKKQ